MVQLRGYLLNNFIGISLHFSFSNSKVKRSKSSYNVGLWFIFSMKFLIAIHTIRVRIIFVANPKNIFTEQLTRIEDFYYYVCTGVGQVDKSTGINFSSK